MLVKIDSKKAEKSQQLAVNSEGVDFVEQMGSLVTITMKSGAVKELIGVTLDQVIAKLEGK